MVQYPFTNYKAIDIPETNSTGGAVVYTTTAPCILYFSPIAARMEEDEPIWLYVEDAFTSTKGVDYNYYLWQSGDPSGSAPADMNIDDFTYAATDLKLIHVSVTAPAGVDVIAKVKDSTDRIGGTLHVLELPV